MKRLLSLLVLWSTPALSEGYDLLCTWETGNEALRPYDYVLVDPDLDTLDLVSVKEGADVVEMGLGGAGDESRLTVYLVRDVFYGGGYHGASGVAFEYREGIFRFTAIWADEVITTTWNCRPTL